jgi:aminopeptidase-like protein
MIESIGEEMHSWAKSLWPIPRSITGQGVRDTLAYLKQLLPDLTIKEVPSGTQVFDWVVPDEWNIREAYISDDQGNRIIDFKLNNLHVVGYSEPVDKWINAEELDKHLHSLPDMPDAIPYVTSYYKRQWGFCLTHNQRKKLNSNRYHVVIKSDLSHGVLNYAELLIPGNCDKEVFLSTYICHPSMANNELSGPVVTAALAQWIKSKESRRYTYRIVFIPETIGSIVYLSKNLENLKKKVIAGYNITCVGDEMCYSFLPSRDGNTLSDKAALHALKYIDSNFKQYTWLDRGSDERQYCAPGVDLPISSIMRSKYAEYPEYHTSLDDLSLVTPNGLEGGFNAIKNAIEIIENNVNPKVNVFCEPQLGKRKLYPLVSKRGIDEKTRTIMNFISYCDGNNTLLEIADKIDKPLTEIKKIMDELIKHNLINLNSE